ncbi:MAG: transmembrane 220 family protein [Rhodothermales bacterium]|nr:transmembrane 220 family protein [Rhodothermales bacterium]
MKPLNVISAGMTVLFVVWAYYQLDDVDGEAAIWAAAYGVAAVISALFVFRKIALMPVAIVAGLYLLWALVNIPRIELQSSLFGAEVWMQNELLRETGGLLIMVLWLGVLTLHLYRRGRG